MKILLSKDILTAGLKMVMPAVNRHTDGAQSCILMHAEASSPAAAGGPILTLTASSGELSIWAYITHDSELADPELTVDEDGDCLINADWLLNSVQKLDGTYVSIKTIDGELMAILGDLAEFRINGDYPGSFPKIDKDTGMKQILAGVTGEELSGLFRKVLHAVGQKNCDRTALKGVHMQSDGNGGLQLIGTDSYRMALAVADSGVASNWSCTEPITVPASTVSVMMNMPNAEEPIEMYTDGKRLKVAGKCYILVSSLIDAEYPDVSRLIPANLPIVARFNREEMIAALSRSVLLKDDGIALSTLIMDSTGAIMISKAPEIGASRQRIDIEEFTGDPLTITFNTDYALKSLKALTGKSVTFNMSGSMNPFLILGDEGMKNIQLLLPVRVHETNLMF